MAMPMKEDFEYQADLNTRAAEDLKRTINSLSKQIAELESQINEANEAAARYLELHERRDSPVETVKTALSKLALRYVEQNEAREAAEERIADLETSIKRMRDDRDRVVDLHDNERDIANQAQAENAALKEKVKGLEDLRLVWIQSRDHANAAFEAERDKRIDAQTENAKLREELEAYKLAVKNAKELLDEDMEAAARALLSDMSSDNVSATDRTERKDVVVFDPGNQVHVDGHTLTYCGKMLWTLREDQDSACK